MKELSRYLTESMLTEFKQDMRPQVIVIMGKPAAHTFQKTPEIHYQSKH